MSLQQIIGPADPLPPPDAPNDTLPDPKPTAPQSPLRSWRKKYRKLRLRFNKVMDDSNGLFKEEHRALALARRLQEENDQLMEMLLDMHDSSNLTPELLPIRPELPNMTNGSTADLDDNAHLLSILDMPHRTYTLDEIPDELQVEHPVGYMDSAYEEEYLETLDSQLADPAVFKDTNRPLRVPTSRMLPSDKDLSNMNTDSVLSWLRRNHPETFIQEKDHAPEKPAPRQRGGGKRSSLAQTSAPAPKTESNEVDEDAAALVKEPEKGSAKGKKSRDDEPYRPKGGNSRVSKRKREDGDHKPPGRGKRTKAQPAGTPS